MTTTFCWRGTMRWPPLSSDNNKLRYGTDSMSWGLMTFAIVGCRHTEGGGSTSTAEARPRRPSIQSSSVVVDVFVSMMSLRRKGLHKWTTDGLGSRRRTKKINITSAFVKFLRKKMAIVSIKHFRLSSSQLDADGRHDDNGDVKTRTTTVMGSSPPKWNDGAPTFDE